MNASTSADAVTTGSAQARTRSGHRDLQLADAPAILAEPCAGNHQSIEFTNVASARKTEAWRPACGETAGYTDLVDDDGKQNPAVHAVTSFRLTHSESTE